MNQKTGRAGSNPFTMPYLVKRNETMAANMVKPVKINGKII
jgi:hypothetical protein